jgi:adenosine kinase
LKIAVTGSLAYDYIMSFPGHFRDHILPDKVHMLTVSFLVDSMKKLRGGVAGNVGYSLALLGERPIVVATAGTDFGDYRAWLENEGVDTSGVVQVEGEFTASCFINTDRSNNQIVAFYPGAMSHANRLSLDGLELTAEDLCLISPTDPASMVKCMRDCRALNVPYVFDPGKQTPRIEPEFILEGVQGAAMLIGNDYEFAMMAQKTGRTEQWLIEAAPLTVVTLGEQGSVIYPRGKEPIRVPVAPVRTLEDPTGAGDAYLAGFIFGWSRGLPLTTAGRVGALASAYCIEHKGCQEHRYTRADFLARYQETFGDGAALAPMLATR